MDTEDLKRRDEKADDAIKAMVASVAALAAIPAAVNWTLVSTAMGAGAVAIGNIYGFHLTKEEGWKLVRQFFLGAGIMYGMITMGSKIFSLIVESTGLGYAGGVVLDATISSAQAWAIGGCAKQYFRREYMGQKVDPKDLGKLFRELFDKNNHK